MSIRNRESADSDRLTTNLQPPLCPSIRKGSDAGEALLFMTQEEKRARWRADSKRRYAADKKKHAAHCKKWYESNKERCLEVQRKWYLANKEKKDAYVKKWKVKNREKLSEQAKKLYQKSKERYAAKSKKWYAANKERKTALSKIWKSGNRSKLSNYDHKRRAYEQQASVKDMELIEQWMSAWRNESAVVCCWCLIEKPPSECHIDHIIPLSRGGSHSIENLTVSCASCNLSKGAKLPSEWKPSVF